MSALPWAVGGVGVVSLAIWLVIAYRSIASANKRIGELSASLVEQRAAYHRSEDNAEAARKLAVTCTQRLQDSEERALAGLSRERDVIRDLAHENERLHAVIKAHAPASPAMAHELLERVLSDLPTATAARDAGPGGSGAVPPVPDGSAAGSDAPTNPGTRRAGVSGDDGGVPPAS